jgi:AraC-like DNA-binding protein
MLDVRLPAPVLRTFISHYAGFCAQGITPGVDTGLPSRHAHLILSLAEPFDILQMPNTTQRGGRYEAIVCGLQDAPASVRRGSRAEGVHVFLHPLGIRAILGVSAPELASRVFDLSDLWGRSAAELIDRLRSADTWPARFAILDEVFLRVLSRVDQCPALVWAWRQLAVDHGRRPIDRLARGTGWSRRHFTGRFRDEFGVTPKTAARIFRFERACWLIRSERPALADVAVACGYHDQAHLTREWNALAGRSPRAWMVSDLPFLQDYELAGRDDDA